MKVRSLTLAAAAILVLATSASAQTVTKYVRYAQGAATLYGILEGDTNPRAAGRIFAKATPTGRR